MPQVDPETMEPLGIEMVVDDTPLLINIKVKESIHH
jgi:hypothetical protein